MKLVILESPFAGDHEKHTQYGRACVRDSLLRGECPLASHLLYTQVGILNDDIPKERSLGISAGLEWYSVAEKSVVYIDHGITTGMQQGIDFANQVDVPVEYRRIKKDD